MTVDTQVLVVGAGPTGLTAASELTRHGVRVRLVEQGAGPSVHSKALVVQPRTLEVFHAMGLAERAVAAAQPVFGMQAHFHAKDMPMIQFGEVDGPYAKPMMLRQSQTERLLGERLAEQGVAVEWNTGLTEFVADEDGIEATLSTGERVRAAYVVGCDGAHSVVRKQLGLAFEGSTYPNDFLQVDCKVRWDLRYDMGQGFFTDDGALVCLPLGQGSYRFILIRQHRPEDAPDEPELREFQAALAAEVPGAELYDPEWIIRFRLHERLAERFRVGRAFLAGDAGHIHTPAGGQGMNTGIQDAHNLAWKLGLALRGLGGERLLDSYEAERRPIAADVLRFTDFAFRNALGGSGLVHWLRPLLLPTLLGSKAVQAKATRTIAQLELHVRASPIVSERRLLATGIHAGDRAPDAGLIVDGEPRRMFDLLREPTHFVFAHRAHTDAIAKLRRAFAEAPLAGLARVVIADEGEELLERYHLGQSSTLWVVRPDGYLGYRQNGDEIEPLLAWFTANLS